MSSFIFYENEFVTFSDFILSESIKPKEVPYGSNIPDFNNSKVENISGVLVTSFMDRGKLYTIIMDNKGEVGFHYTEYDKFNPKYKGIEYLDLVQNDDSYLKIGVSNAAKIFSGVFFIIIELIKRFNLKVIKFKAEHGKLDVMYKNLMLNKYFIDEFSKLGLTQTKQGDFYIFS